MACRQSLITIISTRTFERGTKKHGTNLSLTVCPEVNPKSNEIVNRCIRALVEKRCGEDTERIDCETGGDASVEGGIRDQKR